MIDDVPPEEGPTANDATVEVSVNAIHGLLQQIAGIRAEIERIENRLRLMLRTPQGPGGR